MGLGSVFLVLAACSGTPAYQPPAGACLGEPPVEARLGGAADLGVSEDGPVSDVDLSVTALVRPGAARIGCEDTPRRSQF